MEGEKIKEKIYIIMIKNFQNWVKPKQDTYKENNA